MAIRLVLLDGPGAGTAHRFDLPCVWIGRAPGCELSLPGPAIEDRHAMILCFGQTVELRNISSNGTYVDGKPVERRKLGHGEVLQLGPGGPRVRFELDSAAAGAVVAPPPRPAAAPRVRPAARSSSAWVWIVLSLALVLGGGGAVGLWLLLHAPEPRRSPAPLVATRPTPAPPSSSTPQRPVRPGAAVEVTGSVKLPPGFPSAGLRVHSPSEAAALTGGGFRLRSIKVGTRSPVLAVATAAGRPVLLGAGGGEISPRTTALALVLLDVVVTRLSPAQREAVERRAMADSRLARLEERVAAALERNPADPLGDEASDGIYQLAARITADALGAAAPPPGHEERVASSAVGPELAGFAEHSTEAPPGAPPLYVEDDEGHKTEDVRVFNTTFSHYKLYVTRDGAPIGNALIRRNKPYTWAHLTWPPDIRFYTQRSLRVGNGKLELAFHKFRDLCYVDFLSIFVSAVVGVSALPGVPTDVDLRVIIAAVNESQTLSRDFIKLLEYCRSSHSVTEIGKEIGTFFVWHGATIVAAFAPLMANTFKEHYVQVLGVAVAKKTLAALMAGYAGADMAALMWSLANQPDRLTLKGEQRYNVWPAVDVKVSLREKAGAGGPGRPYDIAVRITAPTDLKPLQLVFQYPGDAGEDTRTSNPVGGTDAVLHQHRFEKATEVRVTVKRADTGATVGVGTAAIPAEPVPTAADPYGEYVLRPGVWSLGKGLPREVALVPAGDRKLVCRYVSAGHRYEVLFAPRAGRAFTATWSNPAPSRMEHWKVFLNGASSADGKRYMGFYTVDFRERGTGAGRSHHYEVHGRHLRDYHGGPVDSSFEEVKQPTRPPTGVNPYGTAR